jgi:hypothetical protein
MVRKVGFACSFRIHSGFMLRLPHCWLLHYMSELSTNLVRLYNSQLNWCRAVCLTLSSVEEPLN